MDTRESIDDADVQVRGLTTVYDGGAIALPLLLSVMLPVVTVSLNLGSEGATSYTTPLGKASKGFTDEERAAMRERAEELKAAVRHGPRAGKAGEERAVMMPR